MVNISWRRSTKDQRVHAFPVAQIAEPRSFLKAICSDSVRPVGSTCSGLPGCRALLLTCGVVPSYPAAPLRRGCVR